MNVKCCLFPEILSHFVSRSAVHEILHRVPRLNYPVSLREPPLQKFEGELCHDAAWAGTAHREAVAGAAGAVSSFAGSLSHTLPTAAQIGVSTVSGGFASKISGGSFWKGAVTGFTVSAFNHAMHAIAVGVEQTQQKKLTNLEDGIRNVLATAEHGKVITSRDLIDIYGVPKDAAGLIKSFTVTGDNSISVVWNGLKTKTVELFSSARFKDGQINIKPTNINKTLHFEDGQVLQINNPLNLYGNAIGIREGKAIHWNIYLSGSWASPHRDFRTIYKIGN